MCTSGCSIEIILNDNSDYITYDNTVSKFCPINFKSSIKGTSNFELDVYFANEFCTLESFDDHINYTIEWGNGDITSGEGIIPPVTSYKYDKQGKYPLTISIIILILLILR